MPRFVRPAFMDAGADGRYSRVRIGPTQRHGYLTGRITLRTAAAGVSDEITFDAGGSDDTGRGRLALTIPAGFAVEIDGRPLASTDTLGTRITARPLTDEERAG